LACHAALDAASRLCFSGFLLEFIPMKIGAGMTIIVKGFMAQYTRSHPIPACGRQGFWHLISM